jgi:hypothetical protein
MRRRQFLCDLEACVASTDDEHRPTGDSAAIPVASAMGLDNLRREVTGEIRHTRGLSGGDDNLVRLDVPALELDVECPALTSE